MQTFYTAGVMVWFLVNQKIVAQKHCINKQRPALKCDGKCFLSKKIKEAEQKQEHQEPLQVKWVETTPCTFPTFYFNIPLTEAVYSFPVTGAGHYTFDFTLLVFRPPVLG